MAIQGRREGVSREVTPEGKVVNENETFTCGHCQHITDVGPKQRLDELGNMCLVCMRPCCKQCTFEMTHGGGCAPFEKKLERIEARANARRTYEECAR